MKDTIKKYIPVVGALIVISLIPTTLLVVWCYGFFWLKVLVTEFIAIVVLKLTEEIL